jgi:ACS family D-galactonate transporter-like MFS transporter
MLTLLFIITAINYMDRANISIAAPLIKSAFNLNPIMLGLIFSAFSWVYTAIQIPAGWFLDRFGSRTTFATSLVSWSAFTFVQAFAPSFGFLFGCRLLVGLFEAPVIPANSRVVSTWFPQKERAIATGGFMSGQYFGLAFTTPFLFWLETSLGWRSVFLLTGVIGLLFAVVWL